MSVEAGAITVRTVGTFLLATWPRRLVLGLLLLAPVLISLLGGFSAVPPPTHALEPGTRVDLGRLVVSPRAYFVSDEVERSALEYTEGAQAWLGVLADVENVTDESVSLPSDGDSFAPQLPDGVIVSAVSGPDRVLRLQDASWGADALPGVPTQVALLWPVSDPEAVPEALTMHMTESVWTFSPMRNEEGWLALGDLWTVDLPRVDLPETLVEPESDL